MRVSNLLTHNPGREFYGQMAVWTAQGLCRAIGEANDVSLPKDVGNIWPFYAAEVVIGNNNIQYVDKTTNWKTAVALPNGTEQIRAEIARALGWMNCVNELPLVKRFVQQTVTNDGTCNFNGYAQKANLWSVLQRHRSPGAFERWLRKTLHHTNRYLKGFDLCVGPAIFRSGIYRGRPSHAGRILAVEALNTQLRRCGGIGLSKLPQFLGARAVTEINDPVAVAWTTLMVMLGKYPNIKTALSCYVSTKETKSLPGYPKLAWFATNPAGLGSNYEVAFVVEEENRVYWVLNGGNVLQACERRWGYAGWGNFTELHKVY